MSPVFWTLTHGSQILSLAQHSINGGREGCEGCVKLLPLLLDEGLCGELYWKMSGIRRCLAGIRLETRIPLQRNQVMSIWRSGLNPYTGLSGISVKYLCVFLLDQVKHNRKFTSYWKIPCEEGGARRFVWAWVLFFENYVSFFYLCWDTCQHSGN